MRYVNLKKRNTSKVTYLTKNVLLTCSLVFVVASLLYIPLTANNNRVNASNIENVVENVNDLEVIVNDDLTSFSNN